MRVRGELQVHPDSAALARAAAERFVDGACEAAAAGRRFAAALTGGSSPRELYRLLAREEWAARVPWRSVHLFWGDDRAVPPGHPRSNFGLAWSLWLAHVPVPAENLHRIRGELGAREAAREYHRELRDFFGGAPRFDLVHLGLGEDGHVASLFPFDLERLCERRRWATDAVHRELGEGRITLTVPAINGAARVELLVPGEARWAVLHCAMAGALDPHRVPAQLVSPRHGELVWRTTRAVHERIIDSFRWSAVPANADFPHRGTGFACTPAGFCRPLHTLRSMPEAALENHIRDIVRGEFANPFSVLGLHHESAGGAEASVVRAFVPWATELYLINAESGEAAPMRSVHPGGFFEARFPRREQLRYRLRGVDGQGGSHEFADPYAFGSTLGELDLYLLGEGRDLRMYHKLGAHPHEMDGVRGVRFAVWAPNAQRVSVVGDFNDWDGRRHVMRGHPGVGVWDIFIPGLDVGTLYKYEIKPRSGPPFLKTDPVGFFSEVRPATASVVHRLGGYHWNDHDWMERRRSSRAEQEPMLVYEVHLGSWRWSGDRPLSYREMAHQLGDYVSEMGFTHVEFLPVMEHPYDPSWGYQVTGYFAPTSRFGTPDDFKYLVDELHRRGIGVILDWVPAHFPRDAAGLRRFDGTPLYEHADPRQGEHPDWGTLIFNYGRHEVRNFLVANALFWLEEYHIDGLRVDAVASMLYLDYSRQEGEWLPNRYGGRENLEAIDFFRELNDTVRHRHPGALMIAEESTAWPGVTQPTSEGGLGFHFKWNMGWMNDFLRFVEQDPVFRKYHFGLLTFSLVYAFSERFILPFSHDEVVHGKRSLLDKMPGDEWQKFANMRLALGYMWTHPGKQLIFMGIELGQWREWSEAGSLDWHLLDYPFHQGLQQWVRDINRVYREHPALWQRDATYEGFEWIDFHDMENSVLSFERRGENPEDSLIVVCNFTPVPRHAYRIGVSRPGWYRELVNSDAGFYGGSNVGNEGGVEAEAVQDHNRPYSLSLTLPPLGMLILRRDREGSAT